MRFLHKMDSKSQPFLKRSTSLSLNLERTDCYDYQQDSPVSESSVEFVVNTCKDNGVDVLVSLERRIDMLNDLYLDQCRLLRDIKEELRNPKNFVEKTDYSPNTLVTELLKKILEQTTINKLETSEATFEEQNSRARSLLKAIESKRGFCLDREISDALVDFLQSEELREHMVTAIVDSVRDMIRHSFSRDLARLYLPILQSSHRRLVKHVTGVLEEAFAELEENSASFSNSIYKTTRSLRRVLERNQRLMEEATTRNGSFSYLQSTVEEVLQKELQQWREEAVATLALRTSTPAPEGAATPPPPVEYSPLSPPQPADPERSIIDQLMKSAEINKQIQDGDLNGSFENALSASDLSLVMAACRAADPGHVFYPCCLTQAVLLSLAQQLATDMVHDTQLKCRYLEESLINLNTTDPATRVHLPLVVGQIRKHLTKFLCKYPSHVAHRRVMLIIMAADNLLK